MTLLVKPDAFFSDLNAEPKDLGIPALFVLTGGLIGAVSAYLMAGPTGAMMSGLLPGMELIMGIIAAVAAVIGSFVFWVVIAGAFYLVSIPLKGQGSFGRSLEVVGYGYLPQVFGAVIAALVSIVYVPNIQVPSLSSSALEDPQAIHAATAAIMQDPAMVTLRHVSAVVSAVFIIWSAYIWIHGMKEARGLSLRDAALCVGVPVVLFMVYLIYSVTLGMG